MSDRVRGFKRLETDAEFRARVNATGRNYVSGYYSGTLLDDLMWSEYKMQRRIVEDER